MPALFFPLSFLGVFLSWWWRELAALLPARFRAGAARGRLVVSIADGAARVVRESAGACTLVGRAADRVALARVLRGAGRPAVTLRLPPGTALWRTLSLPAAAADDLRQVLAFEMDRMTPFAAKDVLFDCRVAARDAEARRIEVEMLVAPKSVVEAALAEAGRWGLVPDTVDAETPSAHAFDLSPPGRKLARGWRTRVVAALWLAVVLTASFLVAAALDRREQTIRRLEAEGSDLRARAEAAAALAAEVERLDREAAFLLGRKTARPPMVAILDELSRVLPDDTWLSQLEIGDGEVKVWGHSPSASGVVRRLEEAEGFHRAEFRSPLVQDPATGLERFHIAAHLAARP